MFIKNFVGAHPPGLLTQTSQRNRSEPKDEAAIKRAPPACLSQTCALCSEANNEEREVRA